jgi:CRP/FNR family cyclic AMP-dependent transcriptional regulator
MPSLRTPMSPADIEDVLSILNRISLFGGLSEAQLRAVFSHLRQSHYPAGEFVFREGDQPSDIYIIRCGTVEMVLDADDRRLAEAVFTVGMCFGETAVIGIAPHTASAITREDTDLIVLPREALFALWETDKELFGMLVLNIAREACRRLQQADRVLLRYFASHS